MKYSSNRIAAFAILMLAVATFVGCSGKPSGFPSVKPCTITVTDGANPIEGVEVALIPTQTMSGVIVGGKTDVTGVCVVNTTFANFAAPGCPAGEFTVTLKKTPEVEKPELTAAQCAEMSRSEIDKYYKERDAQIAAAPKIVPPALTSMQTSPVKANLPNDSAITVDLSQYK